MRHSHSLLLYLVILTLLSSCSTKSPRGAIKEDHAVTSIFRSAEIDPTLNYFYYGTFLEPDAIMGIDNRYRVQSKFWTGVALTKDQLQSWIVTLDRIPNDKTFARRYMGRYQGAHVLDPQGKRIGIWYSKLDWGVFEFHETYTIVPFAPSLKGLPRGFLIGDEID